MKQYIERIEKVIEEIKKYEKESPNPDKAAKIQTKVNQIISNFEKMKK